MATNKSITELTGVTTFGDSAFFPLVTAAGDNAKISAANFSTKIASSVETAIAPVFIEVSGNYTITDDNIIVVVTGSGAATITLKASPTRGDKATIIRASTATVTINGNGLDVAGAAVQTLSIQYDAVNCYALATEWLYTTQQRDSVSVTDFGAVGDGVTDDAPAFTAAIAYLNTLTTASVLLVRGIFKVVGSLPAITTNGKTIDCYGARILHDAGTLFTFGSGTPGSVLDGAIVGLDYLGELVPTVGTCLVEQSGMNRLTLKDIKGDRLNIFLKAGTTAYAGGYFMIDCKLTTYNGTQTVIEHGEGANSQISGLDMTATGVSRVLDETTLTGATATAIGFGSDTWDTAVWSGLLVNGYLYGLGINRVAINKNVSNFRVTNFYFDFCANGIQLQNSATGGGINNMMFSNGWVVGMDGYGVLLGGTVGSHRSISFTNVQALLAGKCNWRLASSVMDTVMLDGCIGDFANRLNATNTGSDQDDFVALYGGFTCRNGRFGRSADNVVATGVPNWQARYGVTGPAAAADYVVEGNFMQGVTSDTQFNIAATTVTAGKLFSASVTNNKVVGGAARAAYAATALLATPASATPQTNNSPFTYDLYIYGGTFTVVAHNATAVGAATDCVITVLPGDTWYITYSSAPTLKRIIRA